MATPNKNLKAVFEYLGLTNLAVAKALNIDPSLISRYLSGHRQLKVASPQMNAIADFILTSSKRAQDVEWLKAQFIESGLPTDMSTVHRFKQNLILWLATDGDILRRSLGFAPAANITKITKTPSQTVFNGTHGNAKHGYLELLFALEPVLTAQRQGATIDVFLSSDRIRTIINGDISSLLQNTMTRRNLHIRMIVCVSGDTQAFSGILDTYIEPLVSGHVRLLVVHGLTQTVTNQLYMIFSDGNAVLVTETIENDATPVSVFIPDPDFIAGMRSSFEATARYAQPILSIYDDNYSRNILEIIYMEFCTPGALDVVKDSINPMYMPISAYDRFLKTRGHSSQEYVWRSEEFVRFKKGMDNNLKQGASFREVLSLKRLNDIALRGCCRMAGLYFMERGYIELDAEGCVAILNGYIEYLENVPNFKLLILDDLSPAQRDNCWQIKREHHIAINHWSGPEPVMIYSDQTMMLREFGARFDALWAQGAGGIGSRANVISILRDVTERLENKNIISNYGGDLNEQE
jgi:transcriptional regulator with XRE-family HTH domain